MTTPGASLSYVLLGNGRVALQFLARVCERGQAPALLIRNALGDQRCGDELAETARAANVPVLDWSPETRATLLRLATTGELWLLSVYFLHIIDAELLAAVSGRAINLHPALLPWGRGRHTNVWPIIEQSPAGVTLHAMTGAVDAGPILLQREVPVEPWDTGGTLYDKLEEAGARLLLEAWPSDVLARWPGVPQPPGGSTHRAQEFARLDEFDLDAAPEVVHDFARLLRAKSFPPYRGLVLRSDGRAMEATLVLRPLPDE